MLLQLEVLTVNARVQVETIWKIFSFCIFCRSQSSLTYYDSCGPHWWQHSYSSEASEGYILKAECLFLMCLELLFRCIAIFGICLSLEDLIRLYDAWTTYDKNRNERREEENENDKTVYH